ncbi:hypothetical protein HHK36_003251 [Tetracentron sinense]|uniref:THH1/TOM1/TOM3 domain-containing protein n=1 Tax=Tetracentron sinense TaxID=13715 RepID=A0A834ZMV7_TETSI|nr:hypothetical protein HHK36_003251 [Tetracentron sinense]
MTRIALNVSSTEFGAVSSDWWNEINESTRWQDGIFFSLCAAYAIVSSVALIQLIRIELRVPEYGWTTQKVFHLMNFIVNGVRAVEFGFHLQVFLLKPKVYTLFLLDLPVLLFFSTYTLLVLFWAEIYHQASKSASGFIFAFKMMAFNNYKGSNFDIFICNHGQARSLPTDKLRIVYISVNGGIYFIQVCIWVYMWINDNSVIEFIGNIFIAVVSFSAALSFLVYGGRIFFMLRCFPIESKGRRKKLQEVSLSDFDSDASLDVLDHPVLNFIYYLLVEILPSVLVLYILRKLPPKRISAQYHPIH